MQRKYLCICAESIPSSIRGKIRGVRLPQEYVLERVVSHIHGKPSNWVTHTSACSWTGVRCNPSHEVSELNWSGKQLRGSIALYLLPDTLRIIHATNNQLNGDVALSDLPSSLQQLWLSHNYFDGEVDLRHLPSLLEHLFLDHNCFTEELSFSDLPKRLSRLHLHHNKFSGIADLTGRFPPTLWDLNLSGNNFNSIEIGIWAPVVKLNS